MKPTLVLTIRNHPNQGEKILGNRWLPFVDNLREELSKKGSEHSLSTDEQLVFTFTGYYTAFAALFTAIDKSKQGYHWPKASGQTPLQFIFELVTDRAAVNKASLPNKALWFEIQHETIYLGPNLQQKWPDFASQPNFPGHELSEVANGLCKIIFTAHDIGKQKTLLSYRALPVSQKGKECFYCGMATHQANHCPSKMLGMDSWGLSEIGYISFEELNAIYKKVFPEKPEIVAKLSEGVKTVQLRKDKELLVFVSFLDLSVIFQLRFLWNYAFSSYSKWSTIYQTDKVKIDNRNLHLGLDCLRVGQYEQAEELLQNEIKRHDGHKFAANLGLALLSIECNRNSDVGRYLENARNNAKTSAEIIYINLVLSRHFEIIKDFWSAKEAVTNALKADYDCLDVQYRRIQLSVRESSINDREFKQLRSLILGQKDIFIRTLLDPTLLPIQGILSEALTQQYKTISFDATHNLKGAKSEVKKLALWLDAGDKRKKSNDETIKELHGLINEKSYFHQLDISEKANGLFFTCRRLRKAQMDQLTEELGRYHKQLEKYLTFWSNYSFKQFNKTFHPTVIQALNHCREATKLLKENGTAATKKAIELSKKVKRGYGETKREYGRLLLIRTVMTGLRIFAKRLIICECAILLILALAGPAATATLGDSPSFDWLVQLTTNDAIFKKSLFLAILFIAPFIALSWTLVELQRE